MASEKCVPIKQPFVLKASHWSMLQALYESQ